MSERAWRTFFVWCAILATIVVACAVWGCTSPQQDALAQYSAAVKAAAEASAPLTPSGSLQDAIIGIGAAAGAIVTAVGAFKMGGHLANKKANGK